MRTLSLASVLIICLSGCSQENRPSEAFGMISESDSSVWPRAIVDYDDRRITHDYLFIEDGAISRTKKSVYINSKSQFVYSDGSPIMHNGYPVYWTHTGKLVDVSGRLISKKSIFLYEDNRPVPDSTAMMLRLDQKAAFKVM